MDLAPVLDALRGASAVVLVASVAWLGYRLARWLVPGASVAVRWSAAAVAALWLAEASFWALGSVHAFRLPVVLALAAGAAWFPAGSRRPLAALGGDLRRLGAFLRSLGPLERAVLAGVLAVAVARCLRALAAPPLGWDDLTYHLLKAGRFVQSGGFTDAPAPDAWGAYRFFPVAGEILWAWAMLPLRGDALVAPAGLLIWGLGVLGVYAAARELGARSRPACLAALAVGAMPAALAYVGTAYVDDLTLAGCALGAVFVVRAARGAALREAPLAVAALAVAAGTKLLAVPVLALGGGVVLLRLGRGPAAPRVRAATVGAMLLASTVAAPTYLRAWVERGSPFYPVPLRLAGVELSAGNAESAAVTRRILGTPRLRLSGLDSLRYLFSRPAPSGAFLHPGPGAALLFLLALAAVPRLGRGRRLAGAYLWLVAAVLLGAYASGAMELIRSTPMVATSGRYLTPAFAALGVLAALGGRLAARLVAALAAGWGAVLAFPVSWRAVDLEATAWVLLPTVCLAGAAWLATRWAAGGGRFRRRLAGGALLLVAGAAAAGVEVVRRSFRYPIYAAAAGPADPLFTLHPLDPRYTAAWPVWRALDGGRGHAIAATAGFDRLGHNWYLYPLLGSRLQNRVLYVPVTADGAVVDYRLRAEIDRRASVDAWLRRLVDQGVDVVASLAPRTTVEDRWIGERPELFHLLAAGPRGSNAAYRFDRRRAAGLLPAPAAPASRPTS